MTPSSLDRVTKRFGAHRGGQRSVAVGRPRRDVRADRPGRRRQDDHASARSAACCAPTRGAFACSISIRVRDHRRLTDSVGYLSQHFSLYGDLSVDENIAFFAEIHGVRDYAGRRDRLLDLTRLAPFRARLAQPAVGRHEAEARAGLHARSRAGAHPARRADDRRRSGVAPRVLEAAVGVPGAGHHDRHGDAVSRRGGALLACGAAARGPAARARYAPTRCGSQLPGPCSEVIARDHRRAAGSWSGCRAWSACRCSASARTFGSIRR